MSDHKTSLELAREARVLADETPQGPWRTNQDCGNESVLTGNGRLVADCSISSWNSKGCRATAAFIASARTDVPALCDIIESQAAEIERLRAALKMPILEVKL